MTDIAKDSKQGHFPKNGINRTCYALNQEQMNVQVSILSLSKVSFSSKNEEAKEEKCNLEEEFPKQYYLCSEKQKERLLANELQEIPARLREKYETIIKKSGYYQQKDTNCIGKEIIRAFDNNEITSRDAFQIQVQLVKDGLAHFPWFDKEFKVIWSSCGEIDTEVYGKIFLLLENVSDHVKYWDASEINPGDTLIFNGNFTMRANVLISSNIPCYDKVFVQRMNDTYNLIEDEAKEKNQKLPKKYYI